MNQDKEDLLEAIKIAISASGADVQSVNAFYADSRTPSILVNFFDFDYEDSDAFTKYINIKNEVDSLKKKEKSLKSDIKFLEGQRRDIKNDIKLLTGKYNKKAIKRFGEYVAELLQDRLVE